MQQRLDLYLSRQYPDISRNFLQKLCATGQVLVNNEEQKSGYKLKDGDKVRVLYDMQAIGKPPQINIPIIYEDEDVIVVDKPAGVLSHALSKFYSEPSVASFLRQNTGTLSGEDYRAGIVHRLDRATSGLMVCAKTEGAMKSLQKQFASRTVVKKYSAVVSGNLKSKEMLISVPLERNPKYPARFRVGPNGKTAETYVQVLEQTDKYSLLELLPKTGRTHQLRIHMQYIGAPIVGDVLYGGEEAERLMLHACSITVEIPKKGIITFKSQLPKEFKRYIYATSPKR